MASQLSAYLHEVLTKDPCSYKCWLTEEQSQRIDEFVDKILSESMKDELLLDTRTPKQIFKAAVHASRFITRTSTFLCRYEQSIITILVNPSSIKDRLEFLSTADEEMVAHINESWKDERLGAKRRRCSYEKEQDVNGTIYCQAPSSTQSFSCNLLRAPSLHFPSSSSPLHHNEYYGSPEEKMSVDSMPPTSPASAISAFSLGHAVPNRVSDMERLPIRPDQWILGSCPSFTQMEAPMQPTNPTTRPRDEDVLFGRGTSINKHPGNIYFRQEVQRLKPTYIKSIKNKDKQELCLQIIECVQKRGGRFLETDPNDFKHWIEADMKRARDKCSQAFREQKRAPNENTVANNTA